jgi:hypothetical protein
VLLPIALPSRSEFAQIIIFSFKIFFVPIRYILLHEKEMITMNKKQIQVWLS